MRRVKISPSFWLLAAVVWLVEPDLLAPTLLAAAVHELGHVLALLAVGGRVEGFTLTALGGDLRLAAGLSYARELPVALAGPVSSLALAWALAARGFFLTAGISLALGLFNLLPLGPLDGGRAVACLCGLCLPPLGAERVERLCSAAALGVLLALGGICLEKNFGPGLLCMALWLGWRTFRGEKNLDIFPKRAQNREK